MRRSSRLISLAALAAHPALAAPPPEPPAQEPPARLEVRGAERTATSTFEVLLPRPAPAHYTSAELAEFERRLNNLGIFDEVSVAREPGVIVVVVREKWTLIPTIDFAIGHPLIDSYAMLGVTDYNFLGTASQLAVRAYRKERGFGAEVAFNEHVYGRNRWARGANAAYDTAQLRFADGSRWTLTSASGALWFTSPPVFSEHLNYEVGVLYSREDVSDVVGSNHPEDTHHVASSMMFTWDQFRWDDLVPSGLRFTFSLTSGMLAGPSLAQLSDKADFGLQAALPLSADAVLMVRGEAAVASRGNPNLGFLLGGIEGVRGLEDGYYRNWLQTYWNVELRHSSRLSSRWAVQSVLFSDSALFEQLDSDGGRGAGGRALSFGYGGRLIPTWLANLMLRWDFAHLTLPRNGWAAQFGLSQYF